MAIGERHDNNHGSAGKSIEEQSRTARSKGYQRGRRAVG
jgi:hypothetical protein